MVLLLTAPILPGRAETWRRLCQELLDSRSEQFGAISSRLGVLSQRAWVVPGARGDLAVIRIDLASPSAALTALGQSGAPFDAWLRRQLQYTPGIDLAMLSEARGELILEWTDSEVRL